MARDEAYRKAEQKIEEAQRAGEILLDLSRMKLTELPESLDQLKQLQKLYLDHNRLTVLAESLGQLTQLRSLDLSNNQLTSLPESLGRLRPRFIVRSHTLSERQPRWLRGVVRARGEAQALVRGDHEGRVTDVFVLGEQAEDRVWLAEFILAEMRVLNDKLPVRTFVESEAQPGAWTELELLREAAHKNEKERAERVADGRTVMVPVKETLREVESFEASAPKENPLPLFICYARENERTVKQLIPSLKVLAQRGYIAHWRDTDLVPGEDWDKTIEERLSNAQVILFMVSRDFLASDYITNKERPLAMKLMAEKRTVVVPVILSPCNWQDDADNELLRSKLRSIKSVGTVSTLANYHPPAFGVQPFAASCGELNPHLIKKLESLPLKGKPVTSFNPRDEAWMLVETGLKKAVEKMRGLSTASARNLRPMADH